jgi:hypothetical protein
MTDEQINRAIAESLEPKPEHRPEEVHYQEWAHLGFTGSLHTYVGWESKFKCWVYNGSIWIPSNFFTDPAARDLLVRKMLEDCVALSICKLGNEYKLRLSRRIGVKIMRFDFYGTYERLPALAYLKAHGLEVK